MNRTRAVFALFFTARMALIVLGLGVGTLSMPIVAMAQQDIVDDEPYDLSGYCDEGYDCELESYSVIYDTSNKNELDIEADTSVNEDALDDGWDAYTCASVYQDDTDIADGCTGDSDGYGDADESSAIPLGPLDSDYSFSLLTYSYLADVWDDPDACYDGDPDYCYYIGGSDYSSGVDVPLGPISIESISPQYAFVGTNGTLTISGADLVDPFGGPQPSLSTQYTGGGSGVTLSNGSFDSSGASGTATYQVEQNATTGIWDVDLSYTMGSLILNGVYHGFTIGDPTPSILSTGQSTWDAGTASIPVTITGTGFGTNPNLTIAGPGVTYQAATASDTSIQATVSVDPSSSGGPATITVQSTGYLGTSFAPAYPGQPSSATATVTVIPSPAPPPPCPPADPCAVMSNPQAGYTSIVSTGATAGAGTMAVSFSGANFATLTPTPSVAYGPFSTPSSVASSIAALITRNYYQYGLSAKAFGPNVVYGGITPLGAVSNVATGSGGAAPSFTTTTTTEAGTTAGMACMLAPHPPAPTAARAPETTIVAWIDGNAIMLPSGASSALQAVFPPPSLGGPWSVGSPGYVACEAELASLSVFNSLGVASDTVADKAYANAWLLKYSGNQDPGKTITPSTFTSFNYQYRLFADYSPSQGIHTVSIGYTPDPCGTPLAYVQGDAYSQNGYYTGDSNGTGTSQGGYQFLLAETRVGSAGQAGWKTLNNQQEIPWVWSVIEFDQKGYPARYQNASPTTPTTNYQIFPAYSVYSNGKLLYVVHEGTPAAFASLLPGMSLMQNDIE